MDIMGKRQSQSLHSRIVNRLFHIEEVISGTYCPSKMGRLLRIATADKKLQRRTGHLQVATMHSSPSCSHDTNTQPFLHNCGSGWNREQSAAICGAEL